MGLPPEPQPRFTKEEIIRKYKDMVAICDGRLVGCRLFVKYAKLPYSYWRGGNYWKSWSEFQAECGFIPTPPNKRITEGYILQRYAELVMELKKLPSQADFIVRRKSDSSFPERQNFRRLGLRDEKLVRLAAHCEGKPEFAFVLELIRRHYEKKAIAHPYRPGNDKGFVYLDRQGECYRLGRVEPAGGRLMATGLLLAQRPETVHAIRTDDPEGIERYWRYRFRLRRHGRNCFQLSDGDVADFKHRRYQ